MKTPLSALLLMFGVLSTTLAVGQQNNNYNDHNNNPNYPQRRDDRYQDYQPSRRDERQNDRYRDDELDRRREFQQRDDMPRYNNRYEERLGDDRNYGRTFDERDLSKAYDEGYEDGIDAAERMRRKQRRENYKRFTFGLYGGANATRFAGEDTRGNQLSGRLGYQLGIFVRGGGRIYGQIGAEYLTSSSDISTINSTTAVPGSTTAISVNSITSNVNQQYLHVPAYIGVKLAQSAKGVSGVRLAVGAELATPLAINNNINDNAPTAIKQSNLQSVTFNGLANLGFDAGPLFLEAVYHYGFQNILRDPVPGIVNSQRRILSINVGLKF